MGLRHDDVSILSPVLLVKIGIRDLLCARDCQRETLQIDITRTDEEHRGGNCEQESTETNKTQQINPHQKTRGDIRAAENQRETEWDIGRKRQRKRVRKRK